MRVSFKLKIIMLALACTVCAPAFTHAATIHEGAGNGLVAYWNFNEGTSTIAHDSSGKGNNATLVGSPTWVVGKFAQALRFFAGTSYVQVAANTSTDLAGDMTQSAWMYSTTTGTHQVIIRAGQGADERYSLFYDGSNKRIAVEWYNGTSFITDYSNSNAVPLNQWTHVAAVRSGSTITFYANGISIGSGAFTTAPVAASLVTAGGGTNGAQPFNGMLDDVRIHNRALSASEITGLYWAGLAVVNTSSVNNAKASSLSTGLVGWWTMDGGDTLWTSGGTGNEVDKSGSMNAGALTGMSRSGSPVAGKIGQALKFNGSNQISIGSGYSVSAITKSIWVSMTALSGSGVFATVFDFGNPGVLSGNSIYMETEANTENLLVGAATVSGGNAFSGAANQLRNIPVPLNTWHHIAQVVTPTLMSVYLDGVLFSSISGTYDLTKANQAATIGGGRGNFIGKLDDARVYNKALTALEVKQLYLQGGGVSVNSSSQNLDNGSTVGSGLVGLWTFNGTDLTDKVYDRSGSGDNGYFNAGIATSSMKVAGKLGQALKFDGSTSKITTTSTSVGDFGTASFSVSGWLKTTATAGYIITKRLACGHSSFWSVQVGAGKINAEVDQDGAGTNYLVVVGSTSVNDGKWHMFTVVRTSAGLLTIYVDGLSNASGSFTVAGAGTNAAAISIGGSPCAGVFNGSLDDLRVYNKALTATEVKQLYNVGK